jgi:histidinol-phosphate phosphatase family protein
MNEIRQAVILCGGLGARLRPYTDDRPKPMIDVNGRPFLEYLLEQLREQGIQRIVLLTGYRGEQIEAHFGGGGAFGLSIAYSRGPVEWETGRRIWEARSQLDSTFMLLYSDNFTPVRLAELLHSHRKANRPLSVVLAAKPNGNIRLDAGGAVEIYDPTRASSGLDHVEIGYMIVERDPVVISIREPDASFSRVLAQFAARGELGGVTTGDAYHSVSDPPRWQILAQYLKVKRILLIDRDGTLNIRPQRGKYLSQWEDFAWAPGALEGLKALAERGFSFALISNQAGVARGMVTRDEVDRINARLIESLAAQSVVLTRAYVCPHHWDDGCSCRKPAPGLFFKASRDLLLRLDRTFYLGDDPRDCQAAYNARCPAIFIGDAGELSSLSPHAAPAQVAGTIADAVPYIERRFEIWERGPAPNARQEAEERPVADYQASLPHKSLQAN